MGRKGQDCKNCGYWEEWQESRRDLKEWGYCHRHPPMWSNAEWSWPTTDEDEWCGDWEAQAQS